MAIQIKPWTFSTLIHSLKHSFYLLIWFVRDFFLLFGHWNETFGVVFAISNESRRNQWLQTKSIKHKAALTHTHKHTNSIGCYETFGWGAEKKIICFGEGKKISSNWYYLTIWPLLHTRGFLAYGPVRTSRTVAMSNVSNSLFWSTQHK